MGCILWHDWSEWKYVTVNSCTQIRKCTNPSCNKQVEQVVHEKISDWRYINKQSCEMIKICERCKITIESGTIVHDWGEWIYYIDDIQKSVAIIKRMVIFLSTVVDQDYIIVIAKRLNIDFENLIGKSNRDKIVSLIEICKQKVLLNKVISIIEEDSDCFSDFHNRKLLDIQRNLDKISIKDLSVTGK